MDVQNFIGFCSDNSNKSNSEITVPHSRTCGLPKACYIQSACVGVDKFYVATILLLAIETKTHRCILAANASNSDISKAEIISVVARHRCIQFIIRKSELRLALAFNHR